MVPRKTVKKCKPSIKCDNWQMWRPPIFLGMANYSNRYSQRLAELADSLRQLTKNNVSSIWGLGHSEEFDGIKKEITNSPILQYHDLSKPLTMQTDTSFKGLGVFLLQEGDTVYLTSKSLQPYQKVICCNWAWVISSCMGNGEVPPFFILTKGFRLKQNKSHL